MSEEVQNAASVVPRAIMTSIFVNGALGFAVLLVTLFSLNNVEKALKTPTHYPYMQVFLDSTGSVAGAAAMASIITVMAFSANIGILATASRMCWSFCRDRGLPGWQSLKHVRGSPRDQFQKRGTFRCRDPEISHWYVKLMRILYILD